MARVTFVGNDSHDASSRRSNTARLINCYAEPLEEGGKSSFLIRPTLGLEAFTDLGETLARELVAIDGVLYAAANGRLFKIDQDATVQDLGAIPNATFITISGNNGQIVVTGNGKYHVYDAGGITEETGPFEGIGSAHYFDKYTIYTEEGGDGFAWSALANAKSLPALNFANTESKNDTILRVMAQEREVWLFGTDSIEVWPNSGQAGASAFSQTLNTIERGLLTSQLVADSRGSLFFVGEDKVPYITEGIRIRRLIHLGVIEALQNGEPLRCVYFRIGEHDFAGITFADRPAWIYDLTTRRWFERSSGVNLGPWDIVAVAQAYGEQFCITITGKIFKMVRSAKDADEPLMRQMTSMPIYNAGRRFSIPELEILGEPGAYESIGRDVQISLETSRNGGNTWSNPEVRSFGTTGDFGQRSVWTRLGQFREAAIRATMTDPVDMPLHSDGNLTLA